MPETPKDLRNQKSAIRSRKQKIPRREKCLLNNFRVERQPSWKMTSLCVWNQLPMSFGILFLRLAFLALFAMAEYKARLMRSHFSLLRPPFQWLPKEEIISCYFPLCRRDSLWFLRAEHSWKAFANESRLIANRYAFSSLSGVVLKWRMNF